MTSSVADPQILFFLKKIANFIFIYPFVELESWSFLCTLWWNFREGYLKEDESAFASPCLLHSACKGAPNLL